MLTNPKDMTDAELEAHIRDSGRLMEEAYAQGNTEAAHGWLQAMNQAIAMRSPEQVARMEQAAGLAPCFFAEQGDKDRIWLRERRVA